MNLNHTRVILAMSLGAFMLAAPRASASSWSATASACQPDSTLLVGEPIYQMNGPAIMFYASSGDFKFRCNVTDPLDSGVPSWNTLTVGYQDPDGIGTGYQVKVTLYRVGKGTGDFSSIAVFNSNMFLEPNPTSSSISFSHTFNFTDYAYWVTLDLTCNAATCNNYDPTPSVWFVRLH
jgi:hypothetical protein